MTAENWQHLRLFFLPLTTYANNRFHVPDLFDWKVYVYTSSGQRVESADFDLDIENKNAGGITYANNRFYVVDNSRDDKVYVYTNSGQRVENADFDLDEDNNFPAGIIYANNRFYAIDNGFSMKVFVYTNSGQRILDDEAQTMLDL